MSWNNKSTTFVYTELLFAIDQIGHNLTSIWKTLFLSFRKKDTGIYHAWHIKPYSMYTGYIVGQNIHTNYNSYSLLSSHSA